MKTRILALALAVFAAAGCGEAIDINRVGKNVVSKSVFDGEWYSRSVIVDKQFHTDVAFIGGSGSMERIRWEITENQLLAIRSYEAVPGTDPSNPGEQNVIAIFPIRSHFDIRRSYNPTNGVETNVIEENTYDRPWFEREYMRVDWSTNLADTFEIGEFTFAGGNQSGVNRNSGNDPTDPWRVRIVHDRNDSSKDYIETTIDGFASPDPYLCYYLDGVSPCNAASVKVKMAFMRVPQANDYQAMDLPDFVPVTVGALVDAATGDPIFTSTSTDLVAAGGQPVQRQCSGAEVGPDGTGSFRVVDEGFGLRMCNPDPVLGDEPGACREILGRCDADDLWFAAGPENANVTCNASVHDPDDCFQMTTPVFSRHAFFRTDRFEHDRENGFQYNARERLINRWNVWAKSTDAEGKVLPLGARPVKPIVYHLNVGFPVTLLPAVKELEADWNVAFMDMVAVARGISLDDLPENLNEAFPGEPVVRQMYEIRINDCNIDHVNAYAADHDMGDALAHAGIADVGAGNLEQACAVLEFESQKRKDANEDIEVFHWQQLGDLRYSFLNWTSKAELAGPLGFGPSSTDPVTGEIVSANANIYGASLDTYSNWGADIVQLINGDITTGDVINGTVAREHVEGVRQRWAKQLPKADVDNFIRTFDARTAHMSDAQYFVDKPLTAFNDGLRKLHDSGLEDELLLNTETLRMFGNDPQALRDGVVSDKMRDNARPSSWAKRDLPLDMLVADNNGADAEFVKRDGASSAASRTDDLADYLGRKNYCFLAQQVEPAIADLAARLKADGLNREQIVAKIRAEVFKAVSAHEIGHTFGLRHNFEGSADAMNFFPQYWGVDASGLRPDQAHLLSKSDRTSEQMYSSIMDYTQRFNSDFGGVGLYDKAAIKFGYAESVEVFDETANDEFVARDWIDSTFLLSPDDLPVLVGGRNANARLNAEFDSVYDDVLAGNDLAQLDFRNNAGVAPQFANLYKRKNIPMKDWLRNEMLRVFVGQLDDTDCSDFNVPQSAGCMAGFLAQAGFSDDDGSIPKVAVPYSYCSDAFAYGGNLTCNRWDMGTTSRDIVKNAGEMYEFYYPFDAFRRDRVFSPFVPWSSSYVSRLYSRTYQPMLNAYRYFYYYRRAQTLRIYPTIRDWGEAALAGMNFFVRVLQQPEPGTYCKVNGTYVPAAQATQGDCDLDHVELGLDQGRIYNSNWDADYDFRPINIGNYWDKALAIQAMTDSDAFFTRDFSSYTNRGAFSIGYYRVFEKEMMDLWGDLLLGTNDHYAPHVVVDGDGKAKVEYEPFLTTGVYGEPLNNPPLPGDPIQPASSYQLRHWAAIFGMVNLTSTLDQTLDFASRARITTAGSPRDPTIDLDPNNDGIDTAQVLFVDPSTHFEYRATQVDGPDSSIGWRMLSDVKAFADGEWTAAKNALDIEDNAANRLRFERANAQLNDKMQVVDFMVYLGDIFEYGGG